MVLLVETGYIEMPALQEIRPQFSHLTTSTPINVLAVSQWLAWLKTSAYAEFMV